jgi:hypothetical protein
VTGTAAGLTAARHPALSRPTDSLSTLIEERLARAGTLREVPVDENTEQDVWRERIGAHAWVRAPEPVDLRRDPYARAVARRRAWRRRR